MNRTLRSVSALLLLATLSACSKPQPPAAFTPTVTVAKPVVSKVTDWDEYPAHLQAVDMVEIQAQVNGFLESIHFQDGAQVKKGDLLFVIDDKPYKAELAKAEAERVRAETRAELAASDLMRAESLRGSKAISEEEFDTRNNALREAQAALHAAKAAEAVAKLDVDYTRVVAPFDGRMGRRLVSVGGIIQDGMPSQTVLATIVSVDPIYAYFDADEKSFMRYRENNKSAKEGLVCELALANETGFPHKGKIDFFDNQVDAKSGTIRVRAKFENPNNTLVPGFYGKLRLPAGPEFETLLIPDTALGSDQGLKYVLIVNGEGVVERRSVTTGRRHGDSRAILEGLKAEDNVIVNGLLIAQPGMKVQTQEAGATPEPAKHAKL